MTGPVVPVSALPSPAPVRALEQSLANGAFQDVLSGAIRNVEAFRQNAAASAERFLSGEQEELHTTILATERAELTFDLFLQMRNKVVSAYQEIMRMQL